MKRLILILMLFTGNVLYCDWIQDGIARDAKKYKSVVSTADFPVYSPDGRYRALNLKVKDMRSIYLINCTNHQEISIFRKTDKLHDNFSFSSDNKFLIFFTSLKFPDQKGWYYTIKSLDLQSGKDCIVRSFTNIGIDKVCLSYDSSQIYFFMYEEDNSMNGYRLYRISTNGSGLKRLEDKFYLQVESIVSLADNRAIVYSVFDPHPGVGKDYRIFMVNEDKRKEIPVLNGSFYHIYRIVFSYHYTNSILVSWNDRIYKLDLKNPSLLRPDEEPEVMLRVPKTSSFIDYSLSPDGKKLMFIESFKVSAFAWTNTLMEMNIDGTGLRAIPVRDEDLRKAKNYWEK